MERLYKQLKSGEFSPVILLFGDEEYMVRFFTRRILDRTVPEEDRLMNFGRLEGADATPDRIRESVETYPFMGDRRVTLVVDSDWFSGKKGDPEGQERLKTILSKVPAGSLLVFSEKRVDKRSILYKTVQKAGLAVELSQLAEADGVRFLVRLASGWRKSLDEPTARFFLKRVGGDMMYQELELEKAASHAGDRPAISREDILAVCTPQTEDTVFRMTDALGERNPRQAMRVYESLIDANEAPQRIFFMLAQQFRRLYRVKLARQAGMEDADTAEFAGISPKAVWIYDKQQRRFTAEQLAEMLRLLADLDEKTKTGLLEIDDAVLRVITGI